MEKPVITCDVCGQVKGESNHWFLVVSPEHPTPESHGIAFGASTAMFSDPEGLILEDICGQACLHKRLSRWIETPVLTNQESEIA